MHNYGWSHMGGMWIFWILILALIVVAVWWVARGASRRSSAEPRESPKEILEKRYARGEIDSKEYEERLKNLSS